MYAAPSARRGARISLVTRLCPSARCSRYDSGVANNRTVSILIAIFVCSLSFASGQPGQSGRARAAGISQVIEERDGRASCSGVVIQLDRLTFPVAVPPSAIEITEAKHNRSLNDLMQWEVDATRKRLTIRFRPGMGDFGTGNRIEVRIKRDALNAGKGMLAWVLETDPL